jgi:hypothetical protein
MGCDVLCAVCGGPTFPVRFSEEAESGSNAGSNVRAGKSLVNETSSDADSDGSGFEESETPNFKEPGYDPDIVSEDEARWVESSLLLGFNARSTALDK